MANCDRCYKGNLRGKQIARARQGLNYRSSKLFKPNLHVFRALVNGRKVRLRLCTKCLRIVKKEQAAVLKLQQEAKLQAQAKLVKKKIVKRPKVAAKKAVPQTRAQKKAARAREEVAKLAKLKEKEAADFQK